METYQYKCKDCGSKKYIKDGDEYVCVYCGSREVVNFGKNQDDTAERFPVITPTPKKPDDEVQSKSDAKDEDISKGLASAILKIIFNRYLVRLLLTIFFGIFGVHKFADGKFWLGLLYLFTFGLFFVGYLIDVVSYATMYISEIFRRIQKLCRGQDEE